MNKSSGQRIYVYIFVVVLLIFLASLFYAYLAGSLEHRAKNFWIALNNITLVSTLMVLVYYAYETRELRVAAVESKELSVRPIIAFLALQPTFQIVNKGNGAALNPCLIIWSGKNFLITPNEEMVNILPVGESHKYQPKSFMDSATMKEHFHIYSEIIDEIVKKNHSSMFCFYQDVFGNNLYSIANGENSNYNDGFLHGNLGKNI